MNDITPYQGNEPYIFISYSHKDTVALSLMQYLADCGFRVWFDKGIGSGKKWASAIAERLSGCSLFLAILTNHSVRSEYVMDEIFQAKNENKDMRILHFEQVEMDPGLALILNRTQHTSRCDYISDHEFFRAVVDSLPAVLCDRDIDADSSAEEALKMHFDIIKTLTSKNTFHAFLGVHKRAKYHVHITQITDPLQHAQADVEMNILARLEDCPFVPKLIDKFSDTQNTFLVYKYLPGEPLDVVFRKRTYSDPVKRERECVDMILKTAKILRYLEQASPAVVHRGIKPGNLLLDSFGEISLTYFEIARFYDPVSQLTADEYCLGYRGYASPEQYGGLGMQTDTRSDIFSLGITLSELITGQNPCEPPFEIHPIRYYNKEFSPILEEIILKMTAHHPNDRYQSVDELIDALSVFSNPRKLEHYLALKRSNARIKHIRENESCAKKRTRNPVPVPGASVVPVPSAYVPPNDRSTKKSDSSPK